MRILIADPLEQGEHIGLARDHQTRIAQAAGAIVFRCVLVFDHARDPAVLVRNHAAVMAGIVRLEAQHDNLGRVVVMQPALHRDHRVGPHERHVAIQDENVAIEPVQFLRRLLHCVSGAQLRFLPNRIRRAGQACLHLFRARAHDHDLVGGVQPVDAGHQMV